MTAGRGYFTGICWSTNPLPTITDFSVSGGSGTGTFSCDITGLLPNTTYYARAYAMNSMGLNTVMMYFLLRLNLPILLRMIETVMFMHGSK